MVAFRRAAENEVAEAKCFGYVQTYDQKPRRRLWDLMKSQGMQDHQQVVFMSDGGDDVRRVQAYLHPGSEHWIDWFHITMRLTVLQQQTKSLQAEAGRAEIGKEISTRLDSVKHLLGKALSLVLPFSVFEASLLSMLALWLVLCPINK